jgi:S-formylglutathione hydrolase FrmB
MRIKILLYLILFFSFCIGHAEVKKNISFQSKILKRKMQYSVYLPDEYFTSPGKKFPVIYLLHGLNCNDSQFLDFTEIDTITHNGIKNGDIPPVILIAPFVDKHKYYYMNDHKNINLWEDMFVKEFIPYIESKYRVKSSSKYRGITGISMGGYGALLHSLKYPDMYSACAAFSSGVRTDNQIKNLDMTAYNYRYGNPLGMNLKGDKRLNKHYRNNDILTLAEVMPLAELSKTDYLIHCGDSDIFILGNTKLASSFKNRGVKHTFTVEKGKHNWEYWKKHFWKGIKFIADKFKD